MTDLQNEKAFQKQDGVFLSSKKLQAKKTSQGVRFYKKIGLGKLTLFSLSQVVHLSTSKFQSHGVEKKQRLTLLFGVRLNLGCQLYKDSLILDNKNLIPFDL